MVLDGKVSVNDYVLGCYLDLVSIVGKNISNNYEIKQKEVKEIDNSFLLGIGNINGDCN